MQAGVCGLCAMMLNAACAESRSRGMSSDASRHGCSASCRGALRPLQRALVGVCVSDVDVSRCSRHEAEDTSTCDTHWRVARAVSLRVGPMTA